jgi:hypothetical protein
MARHATIGGIDAADVTVGATDVALGFGSTYRRASRPATATPGSAARPTAPRCPAPLVLNALAAVAVGSSSACHATTPARSRNSWARTLRVPQRRRRHHRGGRLRPHPTEIAAVLAAARAAAPSRIVVAFQPHRYSRTAQLLPDFAAALAPADEIVLTDIYAASEAPIPGVTVEALAEAVNRRRARPVTVVKALDQVAVAVADLARPGDLVITRRRLDRHRAGRAHARTRTPPGDGGAIVTPGLPAPADKRFRRAQVRPTGRRGLVWRRAQLAAKSLAVVVVAGLALWRVVTLVTGSPTFNVAHIAIHGTDRLSRGEAMALIGDLRGRNILAIRLDDWRDKLMTSPWVEDAVVRRVLPNTLDVVVRERTPMGIARIGRDLYLVDAHGTVIDEFGPSYADLDLPVIDGLRSRRARARRWSIRAARRWPPACRRRSRTSRLPPASRRSTSATRARRRAARRRHGDAAARRSRFRRAPPGLPGCRHGAHDRMSATTRWTCVSVNGYVRPVVTTTLAGSRIT